MTAPLDIDALERRAKSGVLSYCYGSSQRGAAKTTLALIAAFRSARRDGWIEGRDAAIAELDELSTAPYGHDNPQVRGAWHGGFDEAVKDAKDAVAALQPPEVSND